VRERERATERTKLLYEAQGYAYFTLRHTLTINGMVQPFLYQALRNEVHYLGKIKITLFLWVFSQDKTKLV
jgi:hypothetical protein